MKIAGIGAGGVGGYFGARLAAAGNDVTFVQRGPHLEAMRADGLRVASPLGDVELATVTATENTADIGPVDVVLVTVKSGHTDRAADSIKALLGPETAVITLQNGIENEGRLAAALGHPVSRCFRNGRTRPCQLKWCCNNTFNNYFGSAYTLHSVCMQKSSLKLRV